MRRTRPAILIFGLALVVRLVHLWQISGTPLVDVLLIDSETYDRLARLILGGAFHGEEVYSMNVLYPYFVAGIYAVSGASLWALLGVQAVLDAFTCVLAWGIGERLLGRGVGILAGIALAAYGPMVFYSGALLTPTLITFLVVAMIAVLVRYRFRPGWGTAFAAGLILGAAALGRGNNLLFIPLGLFFFLTAGVARKTAVLHWAAYALGACLLVGGATARNYLVEGEFVPISANYAAFYIGHNPEASGLYVMPPFTESAVFEDEVWGAQRALSEELGRPVSLAESSRHLFGEGVRYAWQHPGGELRLALTKFYYFWNRTEAPTNLNYYFARDHSEVLRVLPLTMGVLAPLALLGMILVRRRWRELAILYFAVAVALVTALSFFVSAEYRLPAVPILALFAAQAAVVLLQGAIGLVGSRNRHIRPREALLAFVLLVVFFVGVNIRDPLLRAQSLKRVDYLNFGTLYRNRGDYERARDMLERSLAIDPRFGPAYASLAEVYERMGDEFEAARLAQLASRYRAAGEEPDPRDDLAAGVLSAGELYRAGRVKEALEAFQALLAEATAESRNDPQLAISIRNNIGLCRYKLGDLDAAAEIFAGILREDSTYVKAHNNLGTVRAAEGHLAAAVRHYRAALALDPENVMARRELERLGAGP